MLHLDIGWDEVAQASRCIGQDLAHGRVQPINVFWAQAAAAAERREPGGPQDLITVGVADAGDEMLVAEERLQLPRVAADARPKRVEGEGRVVRVWTHFRPARHLVQLLALDEVQLAQHLAVHVSELAAIGEYQPQSGPCTYPLPGFVQQPEAAGEHGVGEQESVLHSIAEQRQDEELPAPRGRPQGHAPQGLEVVGGGPQQDGGWGGGFRDLPIGRTARQLLGHDRQIRQLRHARAPLTPMVCYAGL